MSIFATTTNIDAICLWMAMLPWPERQIHQPMDILYRLPSSAACITLIDALAETDQPDQLHPIATGLR